MNVCIERHGKSELGTCLLDPGRSHGGPHILLTGDGHLHAGFFKLFLCLSATTAVVMVWQRPLTMLYINRQWGPLIYQFKINALEIKNVSLKFILIRVLRTIKMTV